MTDLAAKRAIRYTLGVIAVCWLRVFSLIATYDAVQAHWLHHSPSREFHQPKMADPCDRHYQLFGVTRTPTVTVSAVEQPNNIFQQHMGPIYIKHHDHHDRSPVLEERLKSKRVSRCDEANCDDDKLLSESMEEKEQLAMCNSIASSSTVLMASDGCGCQFFWDDTSCAFF